MASRGPPSRLGCIKTTELGKEFVPAAIRKEAEDRKAGIYPWGKIGKNSIF